jgi:hypothetical protein
MFGNALLKIVNVDHNTQNCVIFPRGKQFENSSPNMSSTSRHFVESNPLSLPITNFVKKISFFYTLVFSFCGFFVGHDSLECSKLVIAYSEALWESLVD